jgi:hypothetical protein
MNNSMKDLFKGNTFVFILLLQFSAFCVWVGFAIPQSAHSLMLRDPETAFRVAVIISTTIYLLSIIISLIALSIVDSEKSKEQWAFTTGLGFLLFFIAIHSFISSINGINNH